MPARGRRGNPPVLKRLGQHFLTDQRVLEGIAAALAPTSDDVVLEIGPGRGALTDILAERAGKVIAVELDRALAEMLGKRYAGSPSVRIVQRDILDVEPGELTGDRYLVAGNVPYYITTPILFHVLKAPLPDRAVFLVQREVAERMVSGPGVRAYGALSVNVQAISTCEIVMDVPPASFRPPPAVDSSVVRVTPREPILPLDELDAFQRFVQGAFGLRRKQMRRVLRTLRGMSPEGAEESLRACEVDPDARPETLAPSDFARLFTHLKGSDAEPGA